MIEAWLQSHLESLGRWNSDQVRRKATPRACKKCGRTILRGLDGDVCGLPVSVELNKIDQVEILQAVLANRRIYKLTGPYKVVYIDWWNHPFDKLNDGMYAVLEHKCRT
jgi:hypothetical protein